MNTIKTIRQIQNQQAAVMIPIIRNVMPQVIAQQIVGVQPMTAPAASIGELRKKYGTKLKKLPTRRIGYKMNKAQLENFLRLNDRRKTQSSEDLKAAGYSSVIITHEILS